MKKQLLLNFTKSLAQKLTFRNAAFAVLFLLTVQSSFAQSWDYLGKENDLTSLNSHFTSVAVVTESGNEVPYVVYCEGNITFASGVVQSGGVVIVKKRLANGNWQQVGSSLAERGTYTRIYADGTGALYVAYVDFGNSSRLAVKKYNAVNNSWEPLGNVTDNLYVSAGTTNQGYASQFSSANRHSISFDAAGIPFIVYTETGNVLTVKKFDGSAWVSVGTVSEIGVSGSLVFLGNDLYLSYLNLAGVGTNTGLLKLSKFNTSNSSWDAIAVPAGTGTSATTAARLPVMIANGASSLCFVYFNISNLNRATSAYYDVSSQTWSTTFSVLGSRDSTNITLVKDSADNVYCSFIDGINNGAFLANQRVRFLKSGTTVWSELKNPFTSRGVDEPVSWSAIGIANGSTTPHLVYTKGTVASGFNTPVVRKYNAPANAPVISSYSFVVTPENTTTGALAFVTLNIFGSNFTGATDISLNSVSANSVSAAFAVVNYSQITYVVPGATLAPAFTQMTVTNATGTATLNATPPSALTYATYPATYDGNPIVVSSVAPSDLLLYTISPGLPTGLSINRGNGTISGQSTTVTGPTPVPYTVTAQNSFGTTTAIVTFVTAGSAPSGLNYAPAVSASYAADTAITPLLATLTNPTGAVYTVNPALPAGLTLNSTTGEISGIPTAAADFKNYEVKATTPLGFTTRLIAFAITANLSTESFQKSGAIMAYPNPTTDSVTVSLPNAAVVQRIAVYNSLGQLVRTVAKNTVSLQNLTNGNYFFAIYTTEGNYAKQIIKQ